MVLRKIGDFSTTLQMSTNIILSEGPNILVLSKTGKTVRMDCFAVPQTPGAKAHPVDVKHRRRTPPPPTNSLDAEIQLPNPVAVGGGLIKSGALTNSPIDEKSPSEMSRRQSN